MFVGVCRVTLHIHGNSSLKGKRSVLRRIMERTRAKFNAAVAETGDNDALQRATIGIAVVGNSAAHVDSMLGHIGAFVENMGIAMVVSRFTEVIPLGGDIGEDAAFRAFRDDAPCYDDDLENGDE